ncbi:lysyl oxidase family protein [Nocardioides lentus]|uniref:lysyl oxidase family protein n=1 Tax=Nocardioides lentus TaxID=338077 RepID=UPI0031CEBF67
MSAGAADEVEPTSPVALVGAPGAKLFREGRYAYGDLGLRVVAQGGPLEIRTKRASWDVEPVTTFTTSAGSGEVPRSMIRGFDQLEDFVDITIRDAKGRAVWSRSPRVCLNSYEPQRMGPDAPARSPYPYGCPWNPFTIGSVQGVAKGYGNPVTDFYSRTRLAAGRHTVVARITPAWAALLGVAPEDATVRYPLQVRTARGGDGWGTGWRVAGGPVAPNGAAAHPEPQPPGDGGPVPDGPLADLKSLPAFGMSVTGTGNHLAFAATVWNAGDSPLVVDGFRRRGEEMMDAYQYFFDAEGEQTGYRRIGAMHWHAAPSHNHWHFLDFARYSLLSKDQAEVFRSRKQSFCLANTDAVDYTLPGADWQPDGTDLSTACGGRGAQSVRQVLSAGSGDTYSQYRAGQSFNLKGLPNGQYWIAVDANPEGRLVESSTEDNRALRKIWLGGKPGARTVRVAPVGLITGS